MIEALDRAVDRALRQCGEVLVTTVKANITTQHIIDTGILRDSIAYEVDGNELVVGTNVEYSIYQELGTGLFAVNGDGRQTPWAYKDAEGNWHRTNGTHPRPYMGPVLYDQRDRIEQIINNAIMEALKGNV